FLLPLAIMVFLRLIDFAQTTKSLVKVSVCFNVGYCIVAFYWPAYGAYIFGYPKFIIPVFAAGIIILASIIPTIAFVLFGKASVNIPPFRRILFFASLWIATEYLRSFVVFKFPFGLIGYSVGVFPPLLQTASVLGVLGVSFFLILWSSSFYITLFAADKLQFIAYFRTFIIINLSLGMIYLLGWYRINTSNNVEYLPTNVGIIQGNASVYNTKEEIFQTYALMTVAAQNTTHGKVDVIIWPEGAGVPIDDVSYIGRFIYPHQTFIFSGTRTEDEDTFNTMFAYHKNELQFHDKHFLVPYGEYLPIVQKYKFGKAMARGAGIGFSHGKNITPLQTNHGNILPTICYEATYSGKIHHAFKKPHPDYIVNITNDEWFGRTSGVFQHFIASKFRAVEEGLSLIRASNNGISAIIDPYGRIITETKLYTQDVIISQIPKKIKDGTLFSIWGNIPIMIFTSIVNYYYILTFMYHKNQKAVHFYIANFLENRAKRKNNPDYKRRY
ncbi:MAG: apolipoprotein N-acyltransferase, partial [Proteobacteria bacterium]|nr:apolipoprotein N-acyltransferase [Pseudomonadota bacterium]